MFTGLVEGLGRVHGREELASGLRLLVDLGPLAEGVGLGDSICTSGACLSVVSLEGSLAAFDISPESLAKTHLGELKPGQWVNLERSLRAGARLGGHFLSGHVDGLGVLLARQQDGGFATFEFEAPEALAALLVPKGSIGIEGVSLTIAELTSQRRFRVALIPETLERTTLGGLAPGAPVHLEGDLLGKFVLRATLLAAEAPELWQATRRWLDPANASPEA